MVEFKNHSGIHTLTAQQSLPLNMIKAWNFFPNPANLEMITPEHLGFKITSELEDKKMYPVQIRGNI